uniref:Transmembrane protein 238a n=1 Tax=Haplochromis burtoni TaxID=8153 RepID=A0A3Q3CVV1_HAPBU
LLNINKYQKRNLPAVSASSVPSPRGRCLLHLCIGNCFLMFLIAVVFDVLGVILLLIGIFANLRINGLFYGDFLIYTGSLIIFISLACWLMWYVGNVQVSVDDGCKKRNSIVQLARKLSERLTMKLKGGEESMKLRASGALSRRTALQLEIQFWMLNVYLFIFACIKK